MRKAALFAFVLAFIALAFPVSLMATEYRRGDLWCDDFERAKWLYDDSPNNMHYEMGYALCLLAKGEDDNAISRMYHLRDAKNHVGAAFWIGEYISTGGKMTSEINQAKLDEAIEAYFKTLLLINLDKRYPYYDGYHIIEQLNQIELTAYYAVPNLYFNKFLKGSEADHHKGLLNSPSYTGPRDKKTYPKYSPYTIDSLEKMLEHAENCLSLPQKRHFESDFYKEITKSCAILKETALKLIPMETDRINFMAQEKCAKDLPQCAEYMNLVDNEMIPLIKKAVKDLKNL